jgi:hypothetical protein
LGEKSSDDAELEEGVSLNSIPRCSTYVKFTRFSMSLTPPRLWRGSVPAQDVSHGGHGGSEAAPPTPPNQTARRGKHPALGQTRLRVNASNFQQEAFR